MLKLDHKILMTCLAALLWVICAQLQAADNVADQPIDSLLKSIQAGLFPTRSYHDYERVVRNLKQEDEPEFLSFPSKLVSNDDYAQALHASYLAWALAKKNGSIRYPVASWLNFFKTISQVDPHHPGYERGFAEIASILLCAYMHRHPDDIESAQTILSYLGEVNQFSPVMYDQIWNDIIYPPVYGPTKVFKNTKTLALLMLSEKGKRSTHRLVGLAVPPERMLYRINARDFTLMAVNNGSREDYLSWLDGIEQDLMVTDLSPYFPTSIVTYEDYVRALHWSYVAWALAQSGKPFEAPLMEWLNAALAMVGEAEKEVGANGQRELFARALSAYLYLAPSREGALQALLDAIDQKAMPPLSVLDAEQYKELWREIMCPSEKFLDAPAYEVLFMEMERVSSNDPEKTQYLFSSIMSCLLQAKFGIKQIWSDAAYQKLVRLSNEGLPGTKSAPDGISTIRDMAWWIRIRLYKDSMPMMEALKMEGWRVAPLIKIYTTLLLVSWGLSVVAGMLYLAPRPLPKGGAAVSIVLGGSFLAGMIFVVATLASIGHNNANTTGYLNVLSTATPVYAVFVGILLLYSLYRFFGRTKADPNE